MEKREIKFRAWDLFNDRMVYEPHRFTEWAEHYGQKELKPTYVYCESWYDEEYGISRPCHIMQYTGLKDKNGKERYEGDIIRRSTGYIFEEKIGIYQMGPSNAALAVGYDYHPDDEIIGNIYQHPDLLK